MFDINFSKHYFLSAFAVQSGNSNKHLQLDRYLIGFLHFVYEGALLLSTCL